MNEPQDPGGAHRTGTSACSSLQVDLVPYLYGDLPADDRTRIERHVAACARCRDDLASFRSTLLTVDAARLGEMATLEAPGDWGDLRRGLARNRPGRVAWLRRPSGSVLARAATLLLVAGLSFAAGQRWDSLAVALGLSGTGAAPGGSPAGPGSRPAGGQAAAVVPQDSLSRLRFFAEETNDYLDRSRLVLLEFTNADAAPDSPALREASRVLLREAARARRVAGQIADRRLEHLVAELENILRDISRLPERGDTLSIDRIKAHLNSSGVLDLLEILSAAPAEVAADRTRI